MTKKSPEAKPLVNVPIVLEDAQRILMIIDLAFKRGAIGAEEARVSGAMYETLKLAVQAAELAAAPAEQEKGE